MSGLVLSCSDGRLHESLLALQTRLGLDHADRVAVPGGPAALLRSEQERRCLLGWLTPLVPAHAIDTIVLAAHQDCLAYAAARRVAADERAVIERDLLGAREVVRAAFNDVSVSAYFISLEPGGARFGSAERVD